MWCIKQTQTQAQPNQARPSISSTVPMWADVLVTQHIRSVHVCVRVHIDAVRHRGVLARQRSFVYFMKHVQHGIFLYIFFFFVFLFLHSLVRRMMRSHTLHTKAKAKANYFSSALGGCVYVSVSECCVLECGMNARVRATSRGHCWYY